MPPYKYLGWKGTSNDDAGMNFALSLLPDVPENYIFKKKDNRIIYNFTINGIEYFAKLNRPNTIYHKLKTLLFPNSYFEFKSAMLAEISDLPIVKTSGWCAKGFEDMIVTENPGKDLVNADLYWNNRCMDNQEKRDLFLFGLAKFVKKYLEANLYHRDLHMGNLLIKENSETVSFMLVDPLGIRRKRSSNVFNSGVIRLIGFLKSGSSLPERLKFLLEAGIIGKESEFNCVWEKISHALIRHENRKWFGRRHKILKGNSRYSKVEESKNGKTWLVRKGFTEDGLEKYECLKIKRKKAKKYWLYSCFLQSHGIDHRMPLAWLKQENGNDLLMFEKVDEFEFSDESAKYEEFMNICRFVGVKINDIKTDILLRNKKPCLFSSDPKRFNRNLYFF